MGWDTQINIIVENIKNEENEIASELYQKDAKTYFHNGISYAKFKVTESNSKVLFFTFERRKYLPYWIIQEISSNFIDKYFTVIASCPDFISGPAGLIKVFNGEIIDSYGFWDERRNILETPDSELLYQWFGQNKAEEQYRESYISQQPKSWIDEAYSDNIIDFTTEQLKSLTKLRQQTKLCLHTWNEIPLN